MNILKLFGLIFLVIFVVPATFALAQEDAPDVNEYIVTADTANLRSGPGTNFEIVGSVTKGGSVLVYAETPETTGWLRVYQAGQADAYIADFLVERAPMRFYPPEQEAIVTISGRGKSISDVIDLPKGAYRVDANISDNAFILQTVTVEGDCDDDTIFNEVNFDTYHLAISGLLVSKGCSLIFETDNVDGDWVIEVRDLLDEEMFVASLLNIENGTTISSTGRTLTMPTRLPEGIWTISASVQDQAFILMPQVLLGECDSSSVFNELDFDKNTLEVSSVYRSEGDDGCVIFWETQNVEGSWVISFEKIR